MTKTKLTSIIVSIIIFILMIFNIFIVFCHPLVKNSIEVLNNNVSNIENGNKVKVHFININKIKNTSINDVGDCTLIQDNGVNILIDSGTDNADAENYIDYNGQSMVHEAEYLKNVGVKTLDYVINTHAHSDHIDGLKAMIKEFTVTKAVIAHELDWTKLHPSETAAERNFYELKDITERQLTEDGKQMHITEPIEGREGRIYLSSESYMEFYFLPTSQQNPNEEINHTSVMVYYVYKDFKVLVTGDADSRLNSHLKAAGIEHIQIYQAQHHSALGDNGVYNSQELFDLITPDICVIQANRITESWPFDNDTKYGNFKRMKSNNITTFSTGLNGDITITSNGQETGFTVECSYTSNPLFSGKWQV